MSGASCDDWHRHLERREGGHSSSIDVFLNRGANLDGCSMARLLKGIGSVVLLQAFRGD